jgi:integrase
VSAAPSQAGRLRLLAVIGTVMDTGARVGELCALRIAHLEETDTGLALTVRRRPQAGTATETVERLVLSAGTAAAVRHWLVARDSIITSLMIGTDALWVRRPAGMPLQPRGMQRAYTRAVVDLNAELAGSPGWRPVPFRLEQLRRAVEPHPIR